jgi:hypothetical protein
MQQSRSELKDDGAMIRAAKEKTKQGFFASSAERF